MTNEDQLVNMLSICKKAGKLAMGFESVVREIKAGNAVLALTASDISAKTAKEIGFVSFKYNTKALRMPVAMEKTDAVFGRKAGVFAVLDAQLSKKVSSIIENFSEEVINI